MTVPEPEMAARFYGKIFDPQLFQEKDPPPRFYAKLGTGYIAFGGNKDSVPSIDHFCALVDGYKQGELRQLLGTRLYFSNRCVARKAREYRFSDAHKRKASSCVAMVPSAASSPTSASKMALENRVAISAQGFAASWRKCHC